MLAVAILAAGKGTRMASSLPKVLHKLSGKTLLQRVINSTNELKPDKIFVIVGHKAEVIKNSIDLTKHKNLHFVLQNPQNGTGHAIQVLSKELANYKGKLLVLNGDVPLIKSQSLKKLIQFHGSENAEVSLITTKKKNPYGYGRVFLNDQNLIEKIVEEKDCDEDQKLNKLINSGIYCFNWQSLIKIINNLESNNNQKEIYLTDTISFLNKSVSFVIKDKGELNGINNRIQLSKCEEIIQKDIKETHMLNGVTIVNPASCSISEESIIGLDVIIEPNTHIRGRSKIAKNCQIGPNTFIEDTVINEGSKIINSTIYNSEIMTNVKIGPYSHIRPNSIILNDSKIGNFVEIKNSLIGKSVKINHLSYVGDSKIGGLTNIGAGTITANFDGVKKHKTIIGERSSIGANTVLIAPVNLGDSVTTGAGSVITKNIGNSSLAISRTKQINIENWKKINPKSSQSKE